jgi:murein DD-endopeptidase MepM/ murein hydrolase activator NlpD
MPRSKRNLLLAAGGLGLGAWLLARGKGGSIIPTTHVQTPTSQAIPAGFGLAFMNPVTGGFVTSVWGDPRDYRKGIHRGIDIRAPKGAPVRAVIGGTVVRADRVDNSSAGKHVVLKTLTQFGGAFWHRYLHLDQLDRTTVLGAFVERGKLLGTVGDTFGGRSMSNPHLHFDFFGDDLVVQRYVQLYGEPTGGIPAKVMFGRHFPSEPFIPVPYTRRARQRALEQNIPVLGPVRSQA